MKCLRKVSNLDAVVSLRAPRWIDSTLPRAISKSHAPPLTNFHLATVRKYTCLLQPRCPAPAPKPKATMLHLLLTSYSYRTHTLHTYSYSIGMALFFIFLPSTSSRYPTLLEPYNTPFRGNVPHRHVFHLPRLRLLHSWREREDSTQPFALHPS